MFATSTSRQIYVNGQASDIGIASRIPSGADNTWIGRNYDWGAPDYFNGLIDDARVYNYVLEEWQIKELYNGGANIKFKER